jgi:hypothetical protein
MAVDIRKPQRPIHTRKVKPGLFLHLLQLLLSQPVRWVLTLAWLLLKLFLNRWAEIRLFSPARAL